MQGSLTFLLSDKSSPPSSHLVQKVTPHISVEMGDLEESPFPLTEVDKWVLSQTDEEFQLHTWEELKDVIGM